MFGPPLFPRQRRQSHTVAVASPDGRSAASGVTGVARSLGAAASPMLVTP